MESRHYPASRALRVLLYRITHPMVAWRRRAQSRALLRKLTAHELRDLGLTRADVQAVLGQPF